MALTVCQYNKTNRYTLIEHSLYITVMFMSGLHEPQSNVAIQTAIAIQALHSEI